MSVCTFLASDYPLPEVAPAQEYPLEINIDSATIYDGGADDNYFLLPVASNIQGRLHRLVCLMRSQSLD